MSSIQDLVNSATQWLSQGQFTVQASPETSTRQNLIDPLLVLLGWDSTPALDFHYVSEFSGGMKRKWEDIVLLNRDTPLVFIECKSLFSRDILTTSNVNELLNYMKEYNRVNRYGHRINWGILTNFNQMFFFYVSDKEPFITINLDEYNDKFEFIKELVSIDGINKDGLDHHYSENKKEELGNLFLQDLKKWRLIVANGLYDKNNSLTIQELKEYSQKLIDRLIFIRMLETLGILPYNWLRIIYVKWKEGIVGLNKNYFDVLQNEFDTIESLYDTELFMKSEVDKLSIENSYLNELLKDETMINPDIARKIGITGSLPLDDKGLYGYNFKTLSIDIIGSSYERYLAHGIIIEDDSVRIKEIRQLRKKEGVYYTPIHIVNYIVKSTIAPHLNNVLEEALQLIDDENYAEAKSTIEKIHQIKILDPACGSGSFLISAFNELFSTYSKFNQHVKDKIASRRANVGIDRLVTFNPEDFQIISIGERILLNNLFGVDLDPQAVEITKLNLWLKMLSSSPEVYRPTIGESQRKYLPSLDLTIKCGNSIISGINEENFVEQDFINLREENKEARETLSNLILRTTPLYGRGVDLDDIATEINCIKTDLLQTEDNMNSKLNDSLVQNRFFSCEEGKFTGLTGDPFNWELEFPEVFLSGGFDFIIGNPPHGAELTSNERNYITGKYSLGSGTKNTAYIFIEKAKKLLKCSGLLGLVIPKSLLFSQDWEKVRNYLISDTQINQIVDISKAFTDVLLEQVILICKNEDHSIDFEGYLLDDEKEFQLYNTIPIRICNQIKSFPIIINDTDIEIFDKIVNNSINFGNISRTSRGFPLQSKLESSMLNNFEPTLKGEDIKRYSYSKPTNYLSNVDLIEKDKYLDMKGEKIITQRIVAHIENPIDHIAIMSAIDTDSYLNVDTVENTVLTNISYNIRYLLGLLNSRLIGWFVYKYIFCNAIRTMDFDEYYINKICLRPVLLENQTAIDEIIELVNNHIIFCKQKNWLEEAFNNLLEPFNLIDSLGLDYFFNTTQSQNYGFDLTSLRKLDNNEEGIITEYKISINGNTIKIDVILTNGDSITGISFDVLNEIVKKHIYLALKKYEGKKNYQLPKKIINTIYDDFKIPVLVSRNHINNIDVFTKLLDYLEMHFNARLSSEWNNSSLTSFDPILILNNVLQNENTIDDRIYNLFNLDTSEKEHVKNNTVNLSRLT